MSESRRPANNASVVPNGVRFEFDDIYRVVDRFYRQVAEDELLKVPFKSVHDWPEHIDRLTNFWWMKFGGQPYLFAQYNPVGKHYFAGFNQELLARWLQLFHSVVDHELKPEQAALWKLVSQRMGHALTIKNELFTEEMKKRSESPEE